MSRGWEGVFNGCCHKPTPVLPLPCPGIQTQLESGSCFPRLTLPSHTGRTSSRLATQAFETFVAISKWSRAATNTGKVNCGLWNPWQSLCCQGSEHDQQCPTEPQTHSRAPGNSHKHCCHQGWLPAETGGSQKSPPGTISIWNSKRREVQYQPQPLLRGYKSASKITWANQSIKPKGDSNSPGGTPKAADHLKASHGTPAKIFPVTDETTGFWFWVRKQNL